MLMLAETGRVRWHDGWGGGRYIFIFVAKDPGHTRHHVIEDVAVKHPVMGFVRLKLDGALRHRRNIHGVLQWRALAISHEQPEEVAVQMDWVVHHRVIH